MSWIYRQFIRPVLFSRDSEAIHNQTMRILSRIGRSPDFCDALRTLYGTPDLPVSTFGLNFPSPIGLAAGMVKQGEAVPVWECLGFGFCELGGITRYGQPGNPTPRMFRITEKQALINRMGFNNPGAEVFSTALQAWKDRNQWPNHPVGINLGKTKTTELGNAAEDYAASFHQLVGLADFFVINVSSPNTPNLRKLQDRKHLEEILKELQKENRSFKKRTHSTEKPILVKISPDLSWNALDEILELIEDSGIQGIVATNTTVHREGEVSERTRDLYSQEGGLSGAPLASRSTEVIRHIYRQTNGRLPIIGVGGVFSADDAWEKITSGATLVQIYTGLVYEGPSLLREIVRGLENKLEENGLEKIEDAVGIQA